MGPLLQEGPRAPARTEDEWSGIEAALTGDDGTGMVAPLSALGVDYGQDFALHRPERVLFQRSTQTPVPAPA